MDEVVGKLCLHCTPIKRDNNIGRYYTEQRRCAAALVSLCLTSKTLNSIATRHLYHRPDCTKWWLLAETLIARKHLGQHVKHLNCRRWKWGSFTEEEPTKVTGHYEKKAWLLEHTDTIPEEDRAKLLVSGDTDASMDIMCSLCPNIERLDIFDGYFTQLFCMPPDSLSDLRHLYVSADDPEYGFQVGDLTTLFRAAPNLTTLRFSEVGSCWDLQLTLDHVTHLDLEWSDLSAQCLGNLLRACPRLEKLKYSSNGGNPERSEHFTPREAKVMVLRHAPQLKSFHLDPGDCDWSFRDDLLDDVDEELEDAKQALTAHGIDFTFSF